MNPFQLFPVFSCFVVFLIWYNFAQSRSRNKDRDRQKAFWTKEDEANSTRKKDISQLDYLTIPLSELPFQLTADAKVQHYEEKINALADKKIVNLTGISNTDLKLKYGAPNLYLLSEYDTNFTQYVSTLHSWASRLYELGFVKEAQKLLECAIFHGSDIKGSYVLLCTVYTELGSEDKIQQLLPYAEALNSLMKEPILLYIQERIKYPMLY